MRMKDFHCEMLELSFRFSQEDLDQDAFLKEAGIEDREQYTDEDGDFGAAINFSPHEETTDYHAHLRVRMPKEGENKIEISYHDSRSETIDDDPPYAEDCVQWLGKFFKTDKVKVRINTTYTFDKHFAPIISLPFPLVASEKALAGSLVTGLSILLPKEGAAETAILQDAGEGTFLFFNTTTEVNLKEFDLITTLEKLSVSIRSLVKEKEVEDEGASKKQDE